MLTYVAGTSNPLASPVKRRPLRMLRGGRRASLGAGAEGMARLVLFGSRHIHFYRWGAACIASRICVHGLCQAVACSTQRPFARMVQRHSVAIIRCIVVLGLTRWRASVARITLMRYGMIGIQMVDRPGVFCWATEWGKNTLGTIEGGLDGSYGVDRGR